jgi:hypothetical protein
VVGGSGATALLDEIQANLAPSEIQILRSGSPLELQADPDFTIRLTRFNCSATSSCADCDLPCGPFGYECQLVTPEFIDTFINEEFAARIHMNGLHCPAEWPQGGTLSVPVDPFQAEVVVRVEARGIQDAVEEVVIDNQNGAPDEVCVVLPFVGDWCFEVEQITGAPPPPTLPYLTRLCANWNASYVDSDRGEDDRGTPAPGGAPFKRYPASYARFHLLTEGPLANPQVESGWLDAQGCWTVDPARLTFQPTAEPETQGSLTLVMVLETNNSPDFGPGFSRPDDEFETDADDQGVQYTITAASVWLPRAAFGTSVPGSVPFETWTQSGVWAQPPEVVQLSMPPTDYMNPVLNIAATVSTLLTTPDLGLAAGHYELSQGTGTWFNDAFGHPVFESSGGEPVNFAPPQPALALDECSQSDPSCPDTLQTCSDLVTRQACTAETGCGCLPSIYEAVIPNEACLVGADCPDPSAQDCFLDAGAFLDSGDCNSGSNCLLTPCNGAQGCRCMTTCQTDADCVLPDRGCFDATTFGPCGGTGPCLCMKEDNTRWKMILTHEMGHQVQDRGVGTGDQGDSYRFCSDAMCTNIINDPPGIATASPLCACNHIRAANAWHCLQSIERTGAAQVEGFAQFFASRVWNDKTEADCTFAYYKEFLDQIGTTHAPPVAIDCASPQKWRNNHCNMGANADFTTEVDWLGFLYNLNVLGPEATRVAMTDLWKIYKNACLPLGTPPSSDPPLCTRRVPLQWQLTGISGDPPQACDATTPCNSSAFPNCFDATPGSMLACQPGTACVCKVVRQGFVEGAIGTFGDLSETAINVENLGLTFGVDRNLAP